ncbi:hypothetical protein [Sphingomonas radiodurans]
MVRSAFRKVATLARRTARSCSGRRNTICVDKIRRNEGPAQPNALLDKINWRAMKFEQVSAAHIPAKVESATIPDQRADPIDRHSNLLHVLNSLSIPQVQVGLAWQVVCSHHEQTIRAALCSKCTSM